MIAQIAYSQILGKPLLLYIGVLSMLLMLFTATIAILNKKGIQKIPFQWHPRMAIVTIIFAIIHGIFAMSAYLNF